MMLFDTHAHYDDEKFNEDRDAVIRRARESGVGYILNAASTMASVSDSISLAQRYDFIYAAVGVHPHHAADMGEDDIRILADSAAANKVVAIGEIGLDYYYDFSPRDVQKYWFARQVELACGLGLPIIVHDRDAHEDSINIIKNGQANRVGGVFHNYTGSVEMARILLDNNFYLAFGGSLTFKNARRLPEVVRFVPNDRMLIETDCPYLTPEPNRGKRNDSSYVRLVAEKIAQIKQIGCDEVAEITTGNAKRLFGIGA